MDKITNNITLMNQHTFKSLKAFTMLELIIVMAIVSVTFIAFVNMIRNASYANMANSAARATVNLIRTSKHQSMLIRRSTDIYWVYGTGLHFYKENSTDIWHVTRVRYLDTSGSGTVFELYRPYPTTMPTDDQLQAFETGNSYNLQDRLVLDPHLDIDFIANDKTTKISCTDYYILYEVFNGFPHWYCKNSSGDYNELTDNHIYILFMPSMSVIDIQQNGEIYMAPKDASSINIH